MNEDRSLHAPAAIKTLKRQTTVTLRPLIRDFPYGFIPTTGVGLCFVIFSILALLHRFSSRFSSPPSVFVRRGSCFDALFAPNAFFLPAVKTPPPMLPWFSCVPFTFFFI